MAPLELCSRKLTQLGAMLSKQASQLRQGLAPPAAQAPLSLSGVGPS